MLFPIPSLFPLAGIAACACVTRRGTRVRLTRPMTWPALAILLVSTFALIVRAEPAEPVGRFSFKRDGQLMLVDVRINDSAPATFVIDSGAPHTVFDPKFARELGLKIEQAAPVTGTGVGAVEDRKSTRLNSSHTS